MQNLFALDRFAFVISPGQRCRCEPRLVVRYFHKLLLFRVVNVMISLLRVAQNLEISFNIFRTPDRTFTLINANAGFPYAINSAGEITGETAVNLYPGGYLWSLDGTFGVLPGRRQIFAKMPNRIS